VVLDLGAWARANLPPALLSLGPQRWLDALQSDLGRWARQTEPLTPVVKWVARTLEVLSPQHVITDRTRQLAGVPRGADDLGGHRYAFTDWPKLPTQLQGEVERGYVRHVRTVDLSRVPVLRWALEDGSCVPVRASGRLGEGSRLLAWGNGHNGAAGAILAAVQHPVLEGIMQRTRDRGPGEGLAQPTNSVESGARS
jgi:hypothetical protein